MAPGLSPGGLYGVEEHGNRNIYSWVNLVVETNTLSTSSYKYVPRYLGNLGTLIGIHG